jgi:hypothetical protein
VYNSKIISSRIPLTRPPAMSNEIDLSHACEFQYRIKWIHVEQTKKKRSPRSLFLFLARLMTSTACTDNNLSDLFRAIYGQDRRGSTRSAASSSGWNTHAGNCSLGGQSDGLRCHLGDCSAGDPDFVQILSGLLGQKCFLASSQYSSQFVFGPKVPVFSGKLMRHQQYTVLRLHTCLKQGLLVLRLW